MTPALVAGGPYGLGAPGYLAFIALALVAWVATVWWAVWRVRARARFGGLRPERGAGSYAGPAALLLAIAVAAFAAARPQAGERGVRADEQAIDVAIVLDVSNSMTAGDVQPSRLGRARDELEVMLDRMRGGRAGLVIFAGNAFMRSPLTADLRALRAIVSGVDSERQLVEPGSDLGGAIAAGQRMLTRSGAAADDGTARVMLIVSDGEDHGARVTPALSAARQAGIRIYAAGAGTGDGAPVRDVVDPTTGESRDRVNAAGEVVRTRLNESTLREASDTGGGRYIALAGDARPLATLAPELEGLARRTRSSRESPQPIERFQVVALVALAIVVGELAWAPLLRERRASLRRMGRALPLAGTGLLVAGICTTSVATLNRRGNTEYALGNYDQALDVYRTAQARDPSAPELRANAGDALDRQGQFEPAIEEARRGLPAPPDLEAIVEYQLGNHYAGADLFADALEAYKRALLANPDDADAKHNLEVVNGKLSPTPQPTATPQPDPSAAPTQPGTTPEANSTPGQAGPQAGTAQASPGAGQPTPGQGTPGAGESAEDAARRLDEALGDPPRDYSEAEALRLLDLLQEANRRALGRDLRRQPAVAGPEDY